MIMGSDENILVRLWCENGAILNKLHITFMQLTMATAEFNCVRNENNPDQACSRHPSAGRGCRGRRNSFETKMPSAGSQRTPLPKRVGPGFSATIWFIP